MVNVFLFAIGVVLGSFGAIMMKIGSAKIEAFSFTVHFFNKLIFNPFVLIGFILYFIPALIWVYLLSKFPVSYVQPILSLTYVLTPILAIYILKEPVPTWRWVGILIIIFGVLIVART